MALRTYKIPTSDRPQAQIQYGQGGTLTLSVYDDGTATNITSGTIAVKRPGGGPCTTPVTADAVTVSTNTATYALAAGNADYLAPAYGYAPWTAEWTLVIGGSTYVVPQTFDVVKYKASCVVTQDDLKVYHPNLTDSLYSTEADAQSYITEAWEDVYRLLIAAGNRPYLVLNLEELRRLTEFRALHLFFNTRPSRANSDRYAELAKQYLDRFNAAVASTQFTYDFDQTGTATTNETNRPVNSFGVRF